MYMSDIVGKIPSLVGNRISAVETSGSQHGAHGVSRGPQKNSKYFDFTVSLN